MARKSPLNKLQESVVGTVKGAITHPVESAEKAVEQAKGTLSLGRMVAGQVTKSAAGVVASRMPGHRGGTPTPVVRPTEQPLRAVPDDPAPQARTPQTPAQQETTADEPAARRTPIKKATPAKPTAKKSTPKKAPTPTKAPVTDVATPAVKRQAASQPVRKSTSAPATSIDAAADPAHVDVTPADIAKKATPRKAAKAPATKTAAKRSPAKKAATSSPGAKLPVKKSQPDQAPLLDPATTKAVASETATLSRAADPDKG